MRYWSIVIVLLIAAGIIIELSPFNSSADGALAIVSIFTTMIIGINVVNSLELYNIQEKVSKVEAIEKRTEQIASRSSILFMMTYGSIFLKTEPQKSLHYYLSGFISSAKNNEIEHAGECLKLCENALSKISSEQLNNLIKTEFFNNDIYTISQVEDTTTYRIFKTRIQNILKRISSEPIQ